MDFGKVHSIQSLNRLNLSPPTWDSRNGSILTGPVGQVQVHLGCPIWGNREWIGKIYSQGTPAKDFLKRYSERLSTVELNPTFYRLPDRGMIQNWRDQVQPAFKFCPQFFQGISRDFNLMNTREMTRLFCEGIAVFEDHLGPTFLQLPPDFSFARWGELKKWCEWIPQEIPLGVEFRNASWFEKQRLKTPVFDFFAQRNIQTVITDVAGRRDVLHGSVTSKTFLIRFVGNDLHMTDYSRMDGWVRALETIKNSGIEHLYFIVHQTTDTYAPDWIDDFAERLNQNGFQLPKCKIDLKNDPIIEQMSLFG